MSGMSGLGSPAQKSLQSPYAPRVLNILDGSIVSSEATELVIYMADKKQVYQKILLVTGVIADPATQKMDGTLTLSRSDDAFPATQWPVSDSHWKSIAYLLPGPNRLRFDFMSPKLANSNSPNPIHSTHITIHYVPPLSAPPLQLVILLGSDSPGTFDAVPARIEREGNDINTAVKKYRIAAYLWQAYTAEQMSRNKLGRRTFRFEEEWMTGTSNYRDINNATMRSEAKVHVIRVAKTVAELRDIEIAQQNPNATRSNDLHLIATEAVRDHFRLQPGQKCYVAAMYLDSHWDKQANLITGHAALGGSGNDIALAIFGSQALQSYPSCIEEVVPAFSDCTPTDTSFVANDCNESGSSWEAANIGIGAHLHEVGHVFGCPHQESGVMLRDYVRLNRSFTTREPYSTRTKEKGGVVISMKDECTWHRTDCLRFKSHPCFQMPGDVQRSSDDSVHVWPVDNGSVIITAASGVSFLEIRIDGDELCHYWMEYGDGNGSGPTLAHVALTEQELRSRLPEDKKEAKLSLSIKSHGGGSCEVADFGVLISKASKLKLTNGDMAFRGSKLGLSRMEGSTPDEVVFSSVIQQTKLMTHVRIYHGLALDGIEFYYEDATSQLFGKKGGQAGGSVFNLGKSYFSQSDFGNASLTRTRHSSR